MAPTPYIDPYEVDRALRARPDGRTADELDYAEPEAGVPPCGSKCWGDDHRAGCRYAAWLRDQRS